jgi:hypothetical protein
MRSAEKKAVEVSSEIAARYTNPDQAQRFDAAVRKVFSISHAEILRREAKEQMETPRKRGRKPKTVAPVPAFSALS